MLQFIAFDQGIADRSKPIVPWSSLLVGQLLAMVDLRVEQEQELQPVVVLAVRKLVESMLVELQVVVG